MENITVINDWIKVKTLGSGSFGIVTLWRNPKSNDELAVKLCKWNKELSKRQRERWTNEVDMMKNFHNPNIVATKDLPLDLLAGLQPFNLSNLPILCMEFCSGGDLRQILNHLDTCFGLRETDVRHFLSDIKNAIFFLHSHKITHRDLKPENIVLQPLSSANQGAIASRKFTYKLIDLGYAKEIDAQSVCASIVGTLQYLAPELHFNKTYSNSVDFWSFGLVAFEVICGTRPFLPNMTPVEWMEHVKKKTYDHIAVFENYDGKVEYSSELFPENRICNPLKVLLEKWLKMALDWDPKRRGRDSSNKTVKFSLPMNNELEHIQEDNIAIFTSLSNILAKKIIYIYSAYTYSNIAYEIDDTVLISTVKGWVERDTKLEVAYQEILATNLQKINNEDFACKFWDDSGRTTLFLYHKDDLIDSKIQPKVPNLIQICLRDPKSLYSFNNARDLYRNCLYFVNTEKDLYDMMITAFILKIEALKVEGKHLLVKHNDIDKLLSNLNATKAILLKLMDINKDKVSQFEDNKASKFYNIDKKEFVAGNVLIGNINKLNEAWDQLTTRIQSAVRRANELNAVDICKQLESNNPLINLKQEASKSYINFKMKEKDHRTNNRPCLDAVRICYNCLKSRDKLLQELKNHTFTHKYNSIHLEYGKISDIIVSAENNIKKYLQEVTDSATAIHSLVWDLVLPKSTMQYQDSFENDLPLTISHIDKQSSGKFKIGETVTNYKNNSLTSPSLLNGNNLESLLQDSILLRNSHSELQKGFERQKQILLNDLNDYDFLYDNAD